MREVTVKANLNKAQYEATHVRGNDISVQPTALSQSAMK